MLALGNRAGIWAPLNESLKCAPCFSRVVNRLPDEVSFEEFKKLDIRVGIITSAERVRRAEKLYKILVDLGEFGTRQTISSLVDYYEPNELVGKRIVFLTNLKQAKFSGEVSQGMLLAAETDGKLALLTTDREIKSGAKIT